MHMVEQTFIDLSCPADLPDSARSVWQAAINAMAVEGTLAAEVLPGVERYCRIYARWSQAEKKLAGEGIVITAPRTGVTMVNPWHGISRTAAAQLGRLEAELGLTPLRRGRVSQPSAPCSPMAGRRRGQLSTSCLTFRKYQSRGETSSV